MRVYKIVILGDRNVGKTTLINKLETNVFLENPGQTATTHCFVTYWMDQQDNNKFEKNHWLEMADTPDKDVPPQWVQGNIKSGDGFLIIYDVNCRPSFERVEQLIRLVNSVKGTGNPMMIFGSHTDVGTRVVSPDEGRALAAYHGCLFTEASITECTKTDIEPLLEAMQMKYFLSEDKNNKEPTKSRLCSCAIL